MRARSGLGLLLLGCLVVGCSRTPSGGRQVVGPPEVTWAHPVVREVKETSDLTGVLEAVETVQVRPRVSGFILDVKFKDGDLVKENDDLVLLDPAPYEASVRQARAQLASYKAQVKLSDSEVARYARLLPTAGVSREEYERAVAQREVASAGIEGAKAALDRADLDLKWTRVTAPIDGKIDRIYVTRGNVVTGGLVQGTVLTTIVSTGSIFAYFDANEQLVDYYLKQVEKGRVTPDIKGVPVKLALPGDGDKYPYEGRMNFSSPRFNPSTGSLQLRAVIEASIPEKIGEKEVLKLPSGMIPGRQIKAKVPVSDPDNAILIPDEAIVTDQGNKVVYVIDAENRVRARPIKVGPRAYGLRVIPEGLTADDRLVIKGQQRLRADEVVTPVKSETGIVVNESPAEKGK